MYDVWITGVGIGKQTFVKSPQIENPQILGLIPLSQIRKFHRYASLQIENSQILMINPQIGIRKFLQNTAQLCLKNIHKSRLFKIYFYFVLWIRALYAIFVRRKSMYLQI